MPSQLSLAKAHHGPKLIPPKFISGETLAFEALMGSMAYGCNTDNSDLDVYGFCFPPLEYVFPASVGHIPGFGPNPPAFEVWQEHHVERPNGQGQWDFQVYGVVKFLSLVCDNNPNMVDALFVPERCVTVLTEPAAYLREHRREFLHKGAWHRFRGYAHSQLHKIRTKSHANLKEVMELEVWLDLPQSTTYEEALALPDSNPNHKREDPELYQINLEEYRRLYAEGIKLSKRFERVKIDGFDRKFAYHVVRLLLECEQILVEGDLDIQRDREVYKAIRRGEWTLPQLEAWCEEKSRQLEGTYTACTLPHSPDWGRMRAHLMHVLEMHYGSLGAVYRQAPTLERDALRDIRSILERTGH